MTIDTERLSPRHIAECQQIFLAALQERCHTQSAEKGFWDRQQTFEDSCLTRLALIASEVGEAIEAVRSPQRSDHIGVDFHLIEEEMADIIIRVLDLAGAHKWRVPEAVLAKLDFNKTRPHMHGKTC